MQGLPCLLHFFLRTLFLCSLQNLVYNILGMGFGHADDDDDDSERDYDGVLVSSHLFMYTIYLCM